jgi:similar to spore coat protein
LKYEKKPINEVKKRINNDYLEVENSEGMPGLIDSTIALDFLVGVKSGIRNCAFAITETANLEARRVLTSLLDDEIELHAEVSQLMIDKGWLHPYKVNEQFQLDKISSMTALQIANLQLFPGDTSRLGTFATPNY